MRIIISKLPSFIIHTLIWLYGVLSFLLDAINTILSPIKRIKLKIHCLFGTLLAVAFGVYSYYFRNDLELLHLAIVFAIYIAAVLSVKLLFRPFNKLCYRARMGYRRYFVRPGLRRYIVMSPKEYYKETSKKMMYELQLDFEDPVQSFENLDQLFEALKAAGHISVYDAAQARYREMAEDCCVDPAKTPLYIETSVSEEGVFVESEAFWIENYMAGEFSNPEKRPHIEIYL